MGLPKPTVHHYNGDGAPCDGNGSIIRTLPYGVRRVPSTHPNVYYDNGVHFNKAGEVIPWSGPSGNTPSMRNAAESSRLEAIEKGYIFASNFETEFNRLYK